MSEHIEPLSPASPDPEPSGPLDMNAFAEMFDAHAAHLYDYCHTILGDEAEAASATELALITAQSLLQDHERLRAWLFALARQECLSINPDSADGPAYAPPPNVSAAVPNAALSDAAVAADVTDPDLFASSGSVLPAFSTLSDRDREVLDLVYRHGIRPEDLPAVLGVPPDRAIALLAAAEAQFSRSAEVGPGAQPEQIADLPLAVLPD